LPNRDTWIVIILHGVLHCWICFFGLICFSGTGFLKVALKLLSKILILKPKLVGFLLVELRVIEGFLPVEDKRHWYDSYKNFREYNYLKTLGVTDLFMLN
jgi:hypothetical protein